MSNLNVNDMIDSDMRDQNNENTGQQNSGQQRNNNAEYQNRRQGGGEFDPDVAVNMDQYEDTDSEGDQDELTRKFMLRTKIGKGSHNLKKYQKVLVTSCHLYLPKYGLKKRDFCRLALKYVEKVKRNQIFVDEFEENVPGVTEYPSLMHWLLQHDTRKYIFTKLRTVKGTNVKVEAPTKVAYHYLAGIALQFGGSEFKQWYNSGLEAKRALSYTNRKFQVASFMQVIPEYMQPSEGAQAERFGASMANAADKEVLLETNPLFKHLYTEGLVQDQRSFRKYVDKMKQANLHLTGMERVEEVHSLLLAQIQRNEAYQQDTETKMKAQIANEDDKYKHLLIKNLVILGFTNFDRYWVKNFTNYDFKMLVKYIYDTIENLRKNLPDINERKVAYEVLGRYILTWFQNKDNK